MTWLDLTPWTTQRGFPAVDGQIKPVTAGMSFCITNYLRICVNAFACLCTLWCVCVRACLQVCNCNYIIPPQFLIVCFNIFLRLALSSKQKRGREVPVMEIPLMQQRRERQHRELSKNSHHLAKIQHWKISLVQLLLNQQSLSPNVR